MSLLLTGLMLGIELLIPGEASLAQFAPHPLWIPVILASALYGTSSGLTAATLAILASFVAGWPQMDNFGDYFADAVHVWTQPVLWLVCALLLGEIRNGQRSEVAELDRKLGEALQARQSIGDFCKTLQAHVVVLERQCATTQSSSSSDSFESLVALGTCDESDLGQALGAAIDRLIGASTEYVVYHRKGDSLVASQQLRRGVAAVEPSFDTKSPIYDAIVFEHRSLSALRERDGELFDGAALFAAPIAVPGSGPVCGMLFVGFAEAAAPSHATEAAVRTIATELARHSAFDVETGMAAAA